MDDIVLVKESLDGKSPKLYYLIYLKEKIYIENIQKLIKKIAYLQQLFKKHDSRNLNQPYAAFLYINKDTLSPQMTVKYNVKVVFFNTIYKFTLLKNSRL